MTIAVHTVVLNIFIFPAIAVFSPRIGNSPRLNPAREFHVWRLEIILPRPIDASRGQTP